MSPLSPPFPTPLPVVSEFPEYFREKRFHCISNGLQHYNAHFYKQFAVFLPVVHDVQRVLRLLGGADAEEHVS